MEVTEAVSGTAAFLQLVKQALDEVDGQLEPMISTLWRAYQEDRTIFLVGNGGSAANASHFGHDLCTATLPDRSVTKRFRAMPLTDNVPFITALANDHGYETVFLEQLKTHGRRGDVLVVFSGSGNSVNVLKAAEYANANGMTTAGFTGCDGGRLGRLSHVHVNAPVRDIGMAEAIHGVMIHAVLRELSRRVRQLHPDSP